jgi:hypothetical protein
MLKVDSLICPYNSNPIPVKQFLMIDFDKDCLTIPEWEEGDREDNKPPIQSDLYIKHLKKPLKCDIKLRTDRLLQIVQMYELGQKVIESSTVRLYPNKYKCNSNKYTIIDYMLDPKLLAYIQKEGE